MRLPHRHKFLEAFPSGLFSSPRSGFFLPIALALAVFLVGVAVVTAGYLRHTLAAPVRARFQARAAASLAIDTALDQLSSIASDDRAATAPAALSAAATSAWSAAYAPGSTAPTYLTSGDHPTPTFAGDVTFPTGATATSVATPFGRIAFYTTDLSSLVPTTLSDRTLALDPAFGDSPALLRHQILPTPATSSVPVSLTTPASWGILSNPTTGGLKTDLDTAAAGSPTDLISRIRAWRSPTDFVKGRPLIWAECAVLAGIYQGDDNRPQLGLAFWADAWNPYTLPAPYNPLGTADLRLRLTGPAGVANFYSASGSLLFSEPLDLTAHTTASPLDVDLYGNMATGEIRFITHYRQRPISSQIRSDISEVEISIPAGLWSYFFETLDGTPLQTIADIPYDAISTRIVYRAIAVGSQRQNNSAFLFHFRRLEPIDNSFATTDPRWPTLPYDASMFTFEPGPVRALSKTIFATSQTLRNNANRVLFDVPEASLASIGALAHFPLPDAPTFALGSSAAAPANTLFDSSFFSGLSRAPTTFAPGLATILPNPRLRVWGAPSLADLSASPAAHCFTLGAFNLNTLSTDAWAAQLPTTTYHWPFRIDSGYPDTAISDAQRATWASAIVARLRARGTPWRSVAEFASENLLPPDILGQLAPILTPRGDTFLIHAYGSAPSSDATAFATALVQRLPTPTVEGATTRRFQILSITYQ